MFHLKHRFHFMRRGIENVRDALTYNFCKMIELKKDNSNKRPKYSMGECEI